MAAAKTLRKMLNYYQQSEERDPYMALALLYEFNHQCVPQKAQVKQLNQSQQILEKVIDLVETEERYALNVNDLAAELKVNRATLQRSFKQYMQKTPLEYLHECRLSKACTLLLSTDWTILRIAQHCGFKNDKHFINSFHDTVGTTPHQWRILNR